MTERLAEEVIWDTRKAVPLKKFETTDKLPCIVQLAGKDSRRPTPPELSSPALLFHSVITHKRIICQCPGASVDEKPAKKFSMPFAYNGLVEVLSENGEASQSFRSISDVAEAAVEQFLVRSRIECLTEVTDKTSIRTLEKGTVLEVRGTAKVTTKLGTDAYLHCTDKDGYYHYLHYQTSGIFSPFAGPLNISGVHTIASLLKRFRLPCTIRVVSGKIPRQACDEENPGVFRLLELRKERTAMLAPLSAKQTLLPVSLKSSISFYRAGNMKELYRHFIFNQILDTCSGKIEQYLTSMHVITSKRCSSVAVPKSTSQDVENRLFEDVDEIYPYIRRGGIPPRMIRAQSLDGEAIAAKHRTTIYTRSSSHPVINVRERSASLAASHLLKQHTISTSKTETTLKFQSTSDSLTLGKTDVLKQFIAKYTSKESLDSSQGRSLGSSEEDIYFTLDKRTSSSSPFSSVQDILSADSGTLTQRG